MALKGSFMDLSLFLKESVSKGLIKGVFALRRMRNSATYCLFVDSNSLDEADPLIPVMPINSARALSFFTFHEKTNHPVLFIARPCEIRALIELVKLEQANLENVFLMGVECGGVIPLKYTVTRGLTDSVILEHKENLKNGKIPDYIRETCKICTEFIPKNVDITLSVIGNEKPMLLFHTEKAIDMAEKLNINLTNVEIPKEKKEALLNEKLANFERFDKNFGELVKGVENFSKIFANCINCHNCRSVCPICYCRDCFFDSSTFEYSAELIESRLKRERLLSLPTDKFTFHLGRMTHMATSCVGCGMCEDACPMDIPVGRVFRYVSSAVQDLFDYLPGRSLEEPLPLTTYRVDELQDVEDK